MTRLDRFEWDLLRHIWFSCICFFIPFTGGAFLVGFLSSFIFEFPSPLTVKETLAYTISISLVLGVVATLCEELVDLKREVERLKLATSVESSRVVQPGG